MTTHLAHVEQHFTGGQALRDIVIGMSDGLTVPFALAAGLSGAVASSHVVVTAGIAEVAAGAIAMGLGGYLAARSDADHYQAERSRELREIREIPEAEQAEIETLFTAYGVPAQACQPLIEALRQNPSHWADFMMKFELGLEEPNPRQALRTALTIAGAYIVGGLIPLFPYFFVTTPTQGLAPSSAVTLVALAIFGAVKGRFTTGKILAGAVQTVLIGGLAATAAFGLARLLG